MAALKAEGTTPDQRDKFMARVKDGHMQSMTKQRRGTLRGSAGDELRSVFSSLTVLTLDTSKYFQTQEGKALQFAEGTWPDNACLDFAFHCQMMSIHFPLLLLRGL